MVYNLMVHPFFVFENLQQSIKNKPKIKFIAENFLLRWHPEVWFFKCLNEWKLMPISSFPVLLFTEKKKKEARYLFFSFWISSRTLQMFKYLTYYICLHNTQKLTEHTENRTKEYAIYIYYFFGAKTYLYIIL